MAKIKEIVKHCQKTNDTGQIPLDQCAFSNNTKLYVHCHNNKDENIHIFALSGELLERERETSKLSLVVLDKNSTKIMHDVT